MAKCNKCGKSGLFLRVDGRGLCAACANQRLKELWTLANENSDRLRFPVKFTEAAVMGMVFPAIQNAMRICLDSASIVESTSNPETFYSRLDLLSKRANYLLEFERIDPKLFKGESPSLIVAGIDALRNESEVKMWKRCFDETMDKVDKLKSEKGKKNALDRFFALADQHQEHMSKTACKTIEAFKRRFELQYKSKQ